MKTLLCDLAQLYLLILLARVILSWFPMSEGSVMASIYSMLYSITEPVLAPMRRMIPALRMGGMGLDISPIIVFLVLQLLVIPLLCR